MKILVDTNVLLDIALERQPFFADSLQVLSLIFHKQLEGYLSASTVSDLYYIIRRNKGHAPSIDFIRRILTFCRVAVVDQDAIESALDSNFGDFEDAIQHSTAIINQLDLIVTRNPNDYTDSTIQILTPIQLLGEFRRE